MTLSELTDPVVPDRQQPVCACRCVGEYPVIHTLPWSGLRAGARVQVVHEEWASMLPVCSDVCPGHGYRSWSWISSHRGTSTSWISSHRGHATTSSDDTSPRSWGGSSRNCASHSSSRSSVNHPASSESPAEVVSACSVSGSLLSPLPPLRLLSSSACYHCRMVASWGYCRRNYTSQWEYRYEWGFIDASTARGMNCAPILR